MTQRLLFQQAIKQRCMENGFSADSMWVLATGVLVTRLNGHGDLGFFFCYDSTKMKLEDTRHSSDRMAEPLFREIEWASYTGHSRMISRIFRFGGDPNPITNPESAINYAKLVLSRLDGGEIDWLTFPHEVNIFV